MKMRIFLICLLKFGASVGLAQTLACTFQFTGSGTLGTSSFTNAAITVTTVGNTSNRQAYGWPGYYIVDDSASISISGIGTFRFIVPIFSFVETPGDNSPGTGSTQFGFGTNYIAGATLGPYAELFGIGLSGFNPWNMSTSVGAISVAQPGGYTGDWNETPIITTGGTVNLYNAYTSGSFQATLTGAPPTATLSRAGVISQIASGGGWATVITLVNTSSAAIQVAVALHNNDGSALSLPVTTTQQGASQMTTTDTVNATVNPNSTLLISMGGALASTAVGWADVLSSGSVSGFAIFSWTQQNGSPPSEGTAPLQSAFPNTIALAYDNTAGSVMGVALANLSTLPANVTATMWDANGNQLGTQTFPIPGNGHTSFALPTQFPVTAGTLGIIQFQTPAGIAGLGLRFSPAGTFTSVPTL